MHPKRTKLIHLKNISKCVPCAFNLCPTGQQAQLTEQPHFLFLSLSLSLFFIVRLDVNFSLAVHSSVTPSFLFLLLAHTNTHRIKATNNLSTSFKRTRLAVVPHRSVVSSSDNYKQREGRNGWGNQRRNVCPIDQDEEEPDRSDRDETSRQSPQYLQTFIHSLIKSFLIHLPLTSETFHAVKFGEQLIDHSIGHSR
jgi:hypothetical protein